MRSSHAPTPIWRLSPTGLRARRGSASCRRIAATRSNTSVCLVVVDPVVTTRSIDAQAAFAKSLSTLVEKEGAGFDIGAYRDAPAGLRIWCGATVETSDVVALTHWLDWAYAETKDTLQKAA